MLVFASDVSLGSHAVHDRNEQYNLASIVLLIEGRLPCERIMISERPHLPTTLLYEVRIRLFGFLLLNFTWRNAVLVVLAEHLSMLS